jgi:hypothetical protein
MREKSNKLGGEGAMESRPRLLFPCYPRQLEEFQRTEGESSPLAHVSVSNSRLRLSIWLPVTLLNRCTTRASSYDGPLSCPITLSGRIRPLLIPESQSFSATLASSPLFNGRDSITFTLTLVSKHTSRCSLPCLFLRTTHTLHVVVYIYLTFTSSLSCPLY